MSDQDDALTEIATDQLAILRRQRDDLREALHNSDSLLRALGSPSDPVIQTALAENAKALANLNKTDTET